MSNNRHQVSSKTSTIIISVVICSHNNCFSLKQAIASISNQTFDASLFEILVVDNNSTDNTKAEVKQIAEVSRVSILYLFETIQGLSHARNTGAAHARGEIVIYMDDDAIAGKNWLAEVVAAFDIPGTDAVGGPVRPLWEQDRPGWLPEKWLPYLSVDDFSDLQETGTFTRQRLPVGTNMAFRRNVLRGNKFPEHLGRVGTRLISNEEISVCLSVLENGGVIRFAPGAVVYHRVPTARLQRRWFYKRVYWQGRSDIALRDASPPARTAQDIVIGAGVITKNLFCAPFLRGEQSRFSGYMMISLHWGKVVGLLLRSSHHKGA